ncbi:MAG: FHA domain-containing protein [Myxococcota bacterium]
MPTFRIKIGGKPMELPAGQLDIGRNLDCWLTLDDELTSRYHARLHVENTRCYVEDLGSRNGTFLNELRLTGKRPLRVGDRVRIGREVIVFVGDESAPEPADDDNLKRTLAPGEDTRFPNLMGQLVEKSLRVGKIKDAERYAMALNNQLLATDVAVGHPAARSCIACLLQLAEKTNNGVWVDRVFRLFTHHAWILEEDVLNSIRQVLDRIPRVPGTALKDYELKLRELAADGAELPPRLMQAIGELADAYALG